MLDTVAELRPYTSVQDACNLIVSQPAPVVMVDTCGLLDPARSPMRPKSGGLQPAIELAALAQVNPRQLWVVVPAKVVDEWGDNFAKTQSEMRSFIRSVQDGLEALKAASAALEIPEPPSVRLPEGILLGGLSAVAQRLFDAAIVLDVHEEARRRAGIRFSLEEPPARKGSPPNDCIIVEHCLELAVALKAVHYSPPCVFVSSNTNYYCQGRGLHPDLQRSFQDANLQFAPNLAAAKSILGV